MILALLTGTVARCSVLTAANVANVVAVGTWNIGKDDDPPFRARDISFREVKVLVLFGEGKFMYKALQTAVDEVTSQPHGLQLCLPPKKVLY